MRETGRHWLSWGLVLLAVGGGGCKRDDADRLARVGRKVAGKMDGWSGHAENKLGPVIQALGGGADARVAARLRWDRSLADTQIQVKANGAVVELQGTTATTDQRHRAVELAETTAGVERVIDGLIVQGAQP